MIEAMSDIGIGLLLSVVITSLILQIEALIWRERRVKQLKRNVKAIGQKREKNDDKTGNDCSKSP